MKVKKSSTLAGSSKMNIMAKEGTCVIQEIYMKESERKDNQTESEKLFLPMEMSMKETSKMGS